MADAQHLDDLLHGRTEEVRGATYGDLVRHAVGRPGLSDDDVRFILWECTPYPLAMRPDALRPYLEQVRARLEAPR